MVEHLAKRNRVVAVFFKVRVQPVHLRRILVRPRQEIDEPVVRRAQAGHERRTRGAAGRHHAVCALEQRRPLGQSVDVRRVDVGSAVAPQLRPQVIDGDEQHVRTIGRSDRRNRETK